MPKSSLWLDVCPNDCNGHGVCMTMGDLALFEGADYDRTLFSAGDGLGIVYSNWDRNSLVLCKCDVGYFSADCSMSMNSQLMSQLYMSQLMSQLYMLMMT